MEPRLEILASRKLIGIRMEMSLSDNKTAELWKQFMPRRSEVKNRATSDFISMQNYGDNWNFSPDALFEKWAAVEVSSFDEVPANMDTYLLKGGKYAVFLHKGTASKAPIIMKYIFGEWLPKSDYIPDNREHFEILPVSYNPIDPEAEEEIWVPIKEA